MKNSQQPGSRPSQLHQPYSNQGDSLQGFEFDFPQDTAQFFDFPDDSGQPSYSFPSNLDLSFEITTDAEYHSIGQEQPQDSNAQCQSNIGKWLNTAPWALVPNAGDPQRPDAASSSSAATVSPNNMHVPRPPRSCDETTQDSNLPLSPRFPPALLSTVDGDTNSVLSDTVYSQVSSTVFSVPRRKSQSNQDGPSKRVRATPSYTSPSISRKASSNADDSTKQFKCLQVVPDKGICGVVCDNPSGLKKHKARHALKYRCRVNGCSRSTLGFATDNDLDRHERTVHKMKSRKGNDALYKCPLNGCSSVNLFDRKDNFHTHLKKLHQIVGDSQRRRDLTQQAMINADHEVISIDDSSVDENNVPDETAEQEISQFSGNTLESQSAFLQGIGAIAGASDDMLPEMSGADLEYVPSHSPLGFHPPKMSLVANELCPESHDSTRTSAEVEPRNGAVTSASTSDDSHVINYAQFVRDICATAPEMAKCGHQAEFREPGQTVTKRPVRHHQRVQPSADIINNLRNIDPAKPPESILHMLGNSNIARQVLSRGIQAMIADYETRNNPKSSEHLTSGFTAEEDCTPFSSPDSCYPRISISASSPSPPADHSMDGSRSSSHAASPLVCHQASPTSPSQRHQPLVHAPSTNLSRSSSPSSSVAHQKSVTKKQRYCCQCQDGPINAKTNCGCPGCNHVFCVGCPTN